MDLPSEASGASMSGKEGESASASQASPEKAKDMDKDKEKDGQGKVQGAGVGSRGGDIVGSPNGSGRKKEVDLVSFFLSLFGVLSLFLVLYF